MLTSEHFMQIDLNPRREQVEQMSGVTKIRAALGRRKQT